MQGDELNSDISLDLQLCICIRCTRVCLCECVSMCVGDSNLSSFLMGGGAPIWFDLISFPFSINFCIYFLVIREFPEFCLCQKIESSLTSINVSLSINRVNRYGSIYLYSIYVWYFSSSACFVFVFLGFSFCFLFFCFLFCFCFAAVLLSLGKVF